MRGRDRRAPRFVYRVYLIESPNPNAFTSGGGHIFVTTGLVARMRTEAQMAMVLAHELAHVAQQSGGGPVARPAILQRAPDKYDGLTIDQLRKLVSKGDKRAAEALYARY